MFRTNLRIAGALLGLLTAILVMVSTGQACLICVGLPAKSDADSLIESHCVMLARENPKQPFTYTPIELLKGQYDGQEIDLLLDTLTRRRLNANPHRHVLLVQQAEGGAWRSLGICTSEFEQVARRILLYAPQWQRAPSRSRRAEFFATLFGHDDPRIHRLAYLELGRAPYPMIRRLGQSVSRSEYGKVLDDNQYLEWRPLAILLLAHSRDPLDRQSIWESLESAQQFHVTVNLAAWATAVIEMDFHRAIDYLENHYWRHPRRSADELREVLKAFSLHGGVSPGAVRERVLASYHVLLEHHPNMTQFVAEDVKAWRQGEIAPLQGASRTRPDDPESSKAGSSRNTGSLPE